MSHSGGSLFKEGRRRWRGKVQIDGKVFRVRATTRTEASKRLEKVIKDHEAALEAPVRRWTVSEWLDQCGTRARLLYSRV